MKSDGMKPIAVEVWNDTSKVSVNSDGSINVLGASGLVPNPKDYMGFTYSGDDLTSIVYKTGGSGGTTVATLTFAYTGDNLTSITRT